MPGMPSGIDMPADWHSSQTSVLAALAMNKNALVPRNTQSDARATRL